MAFLFAQFGMVVHASTHLKLDSHATPTQLCGQCLSSASLQNMVGSGAIVLQAVVVARQHGEEPVAVPGAPRHPFAAFRSRAPPQLL